MANIIYVRTIAIRGYEISPDRLLLFANFEKYGTVPVPYGTVPVIRIVFFLKNVTYRTQTESTSTVLKSSQLNRGLYKYYSQ